MNPVALITALFNAVAGIFGYQTKQSELKNSPEMKKRDEAQKENAQDDQDTKDISDKNLDAVRRSAS